jgi:transposase
LALDETCFSNGELYTILTNKAKKGLKGSIVAIIKGTKSDYIIQQINKYIPASLRAQVKEVSLDMAGSMNLIAKKCFPKAERVIDRFHVQKLASEAVQYLRIKNRWEAIKTEKEQEDLAKKNNKEYCKEVFSNGESRKQLLARSRYLLFKPCNRWSLDQETRANILFGEYPEIENAYKLAQHLTYIYEQCVTKDIARLKMAKWFNRIDDEENEEFAALKNTFYKHYDGILNFFNKRSTNAAAESFNAKVKNFRRAFRGVADLSFFMFRLTKIYA